jgi:hypothetical protein
VIPAGSSDRTLGALAAAYSGAGLFPDGATLLPAADIASAAVSHCEDAADVTGLDSIYLADLYDEMGRTDSLPPRSELSALVAAIVGGAV